MDARWVAVGAAKSQIERQSTSTRTSCCRNNMLAFHRRRPKKPSAQKLVDSGRVFQKGVRAQRQRMPTCSKVDAPVVGQCTEECASQ